jgi:uncharacterized peroxidase-related enzyme
LDDLVEGLLGILPGSALFALRAERADIRRTTEGAYRALVQPEDPGHVPAGVRAAIAERVARCDGEPALAAHYAGLNPAPIPPLLRRYADLVASQPDRVTQGDIDALRAAGLSPQDVVAVTQLAAFVPFQVRVLAGLRAMMADRPATAVPVVAAAARFTMDEVPWTPRLPPVEAATATPAQVAALDACPPAVRRSGYFLTLAQDPASLAERGALFNSVMYAPRGLPRVDRELATAIVSMVNGCVYCTSVHARRFAELSHEPATMQRLLDDGLDTPLDARRRAIADVAARLTAAPASFASADLAPLRAVGLAELEVLDVIHATAMFANANRLMQALGETG